jgi:hypothetical protein
VFERGGFDVIVGNPPFLGGPKITPSLGSCYREFLVDFVSDGTSARNNDLVAFFLLKIHQLLRSSGQAGLITTNSVAQGDTREVGLDQLVAKGVAIRRAVKSRPWPSKSASLEFSALWTASTAPAPTAVCVLDGVVAPQGISSSLTLNSRISDRLHRLAMHRQRASLGSCLMGSGFIVSQADAQAWIEADERNKEVLFPYLNGQDVNTSPTHTGERWVINFGEITEGQARSYDLPFRRVRSEVWPERKLKDPVKYPRMVHEWWKYWSARPDLYEALPGLERCIVITRVSKVVMPVMVSTGKVFSDATVVFVSDDFADLALLSSSLHYWWAIDRASTMKGDLRYAPTDVFETLYWPAVTQGLRDAGARLHEFRCELMLRRGVGLTGVYNLFHDRECNDEDIVELRHLHERVDMTAIAAYGWRDLLDPTGATPPVDATHETFRLDHGFRETDQGIRYTIGLAVRTEIIDRLRQLNHEAYADEVRLGYHAKGASKFGTSSSAKGVKKRKEQLAARGGSDFGEGAEGALF